MKTIFHLCTIALLSFVTLSCTKTDLSKLTAEPAPNNDAAITSRIERNIVQPIEVELGTPDAIIHQGETVTIFLPYSIANETFAATKITMTDDATGLPINTYDLVPSTDPSASQLTLPGTIFNEPQFFFVSFVADEAYAGKTVSITTNLEGQVTYSIEELKAAFSVVP
jgi:hypothetical protein